MNWLDIVILVALIVPTVIGLKRGVISAALSLVGLIVGVILAGNFYEQLGQLMAFIPNVAIANVIAFILIVAAAMLIAAVIARVLKSVVSAVMLGWVDHLAGAIFGFILGAFFWGALLAIWVKFFGTAFIAESFVAEVLLDNFPVILRLLPEEFNIVRDFFQ